MLTQASSVSSSKTIGALATSKSVKPSVQIIDTLEAFAALQPEWNQLFQDSGSSLPFQSFDWNFTWWQVFARRNWKVKDTLLILVLRHPSTDVCVGIAPFFISSPIGLASFGVNFVRLFGADPNLTEIRGVLALTDYRQMVWQRVQDFFTHEYTSWSSVHWSGIQVPSSTAVALHNKAAVQYERFVPNYVLSLTDSWETFRSQLKRNIRESIRRCYNSPKRDGLEFEFVVGSTQADFDYLLPLFFELHSLRANLEGTTDHPDYFANPKHRDFLNRLATRCAKTGMMRVFALKTCDRIIAIRLGFVCGDSLYLYYSGYNPDYGKYSVMTTTVVEAIKYAITAGIKTVNLSIGKDVSKTRWSPQELTYYECFEFSRNPVVSKLLSLYGKTKLTSGKNPYTLKNKVFGEEGWTLFSIPMDH